MFKEYFLSLLLATSSLYGEKADHPKLVLYVQEKCPYCKKVVETLKGLSVEVEIKDTSIFENKQYLLSKTNRATVPCLFIDGEPLFESKIIMQYLIQRDKCEK
jgi:glutaredoxin 3